MEFPQKTAALNITRLDLKYKFPTFPENTHTVINERVNCTCRGL